MPRADTRLLARVDLASPTLALLAAALGLWITGGLLAHAGHPIVGCLLATLGAYLAFTPMHEAAHQSVGRRAPLNAIVGRLAALPLLAPFPAFRWVHLEHHKHTNDPARDPDHYSGRGPGWLRPLRWLSQDLHYYGRYLRAGRPRRELVEVVGVIVGGLALAALLAAAGAWSYLVWGLVVPARVATALLAYAFDYLPHRPHDVLGRDDRFRATAVRPTGWLTPLLVWQNYHLVHHLYPAVPFYRYAAVWRDREAELRARGAKVIE